MSFREKHLWISILASVGVWGWYFWVLGKTLAAGRLVEDGFMGEVSLAFVTALGLVVLVEVGLTLIATLTTPKHEQKTRDEREVRAALQASHVALMALIALIFCAAMAAYFTGLIGDNLVHQSPVFRIDGNLLVLVANVLLACIILTELIRAGVTLVLLRALR